MTLAARPRVRRRIAAWIALLAVAGCGERAGLPLMLEDASVSTAPDAGTSIDSGAVTYCVPGIRCNPANDPCLAGTTSCAPELPECSGVTKAADGTQCGVNQMCSDGKCVACMGGIRCNPGGNVCQTGLTSCAFGSSTCGPIGNVTNGAPCGTNEVCFEGVCTPCVADTPCTPNGNACKVGRFSCRSGQATCVATGDVVNGTSCAAGMCCGGLCAACGTPANATSFCSATACSFACFASLTLCGGACVDTTSDADACGPSCTACPAGATCVNSECAS